MTTKRWIAIIAASVLVFVSLGVNLFSYKFTSDTSKLMDQLAKAEEQMNDAVIEKGALDERIAVLSIEGAIQDTGEASLFATEGYNHRQFMKQLDEVKADETVKGVILKVNSPGGGVLESKDIYDKIVDIQKTREIPFYVTMGAMAASGGYYVSAPADKIFVHPETMTGSIGVIMQTLDYSELAEKLGIRFNTIKTGAHKDIGSPNRHMTDEERAIFQSMADESFERFVKVIADGRDMSIEEVKKIADGRIFSGSQAIKYGLADETGRLDDAIEAMKKEHKLENATVFEYETKDSFASLFGMKMNQWLGNDIEKEIMTRFILDNQGPRLMYLYGEQ